MTARPTITTTYFGNVDTAALGRLESNYDTTHLLAAVGIVDHLRGQLHDPDGLARRPTGNSLHGTRAVFNGVSSAASRSEYTFPEHVRDTLDLIDEFVAELTRVRTILELLEALYPNEEFCEE